MKLQDKVAIITGSGSGIGRATALLFAREGAKVVINDKNEEGAQKTLEMIKEENPEAVATVYIADVSNEEEVKAMVDKTVEDMGKVDILVNNAGIYRGHSVPDTTKEDWDELFDTNVYGVFLGCKYVIPRMLEQGKGKIVNVSSMGGVIALEGSSPYNATKGAVISMTKGLALDYASKNININCVCPGFTKTPMVETLTEDPNISQALLADTPCGRFAEPEDQANLILWLASEDSNNLHGSMILNDGGWTTR